MSQYAIIGSGLSAIATAKALIKKGVKPIIFDIGDTLPIDKKIIASKLSNRTPNQWPSEQVEIITDNPTITSKNEFPKKLLFGSDYFYGRSTKQFPIESTNTIPPFSNAQGGLSMGWGAASLPPTDEDINNWPIKVIDLKKYFIEVLSTLPYSAKEDNLSNYFPTYHKNLNPIILSPANEALLSMLNSNFDSLEHLNVAFGQARVLTHAPHNNKEGCKYCGYCMSGCVYDYIYKADHDLQKLINSNKIIYVKNTSVISVEETTEYTSICLINSNKNVEHHKFKRIFLAGGAVNSTRVILNSRKIFQEIASLKSTEGFIAPLLSLRKLPFTWPNTNTQPGIFIEFKNLNISNHWIHTQMSAPNELVMKKLGINNQNKNISQIIRRKLSQHLAIAHCNLHSDHGSSYELSLDKENGILTSTKKINVGTENDIIQAINQLKKICKIINYTLLKPFCRDTLKTGSFHVGGSLPMKNKPEKPTDTNLYGSPTGWKNIHVVDSSIFPSIPGTTIGLLAMANATRIVQNLDFS